MGAVQIVQRSEVESATEQRHCPECGKVYTCKPRWSQRICPTCNGQRIAQGYAQRQVGKPPAPIAVEAMPVASDPVPAEMTALSKEITAMRVTANCLEDLDGPSRARVMAWLGARYGEQS